MFAKVLDAPLHGNQKETMLDIFLELRVIFLELRVIFLELHVIWIKAVLIRKRKVWFSNFIICFENKFSNSVKLHTFEWARLFTYHSYLMYK